MCRQGQAPGTVNSEVAGYVKDFPGLFTGLGSIFLGMDEEYVRKKIKEVDDLGLKGFKFWPAGQHFNPAESENFKLVCEYCEKTRKIITVHTGCLPGVGEIPELSLECNPLLLEPAARDYDIQIVLMHFGYYSANFPGIWFDEALELCKKYENCWGEISPNPNILTDDFLVQKIRNTMGGMDRVLFGSDYLRYLEPSINMVRNSPYLTDDEKAAVFGLNAQRLLKWAGVTVPNLKRA